MNQHLIGLRVRVDPPPIIAHRPDHGFVVEERPFEGRVASTTEDSLLVRVGGVIKPPQHTRTAFET